tara:strand:+ start:101 stop:289 length:189 start_codon:yes stop_codon:yes gene_type:complete
MTNKITSIETIYYLFFSGLMSKSRASQQLKQLNAPDYEERLLTLEGHRKERVKDERTRGNLC